MSNDKIILRNERTALAPRREYVRFQPAADPRLDERFSIDEIARILVRRKMRILTCIAVMLLLALGVSLLMTPKYESVSVIEINKQNSDMLGLDSPMSALGDESDALTHTVTMETHANALQSDTLALEVIEQLHLYERPEFQWKPAIFGASPDFSAELNAPLENAPHRREKLLKVFHRNLKVKPVAGTRMVEVHFLSPDRQVAAAVVNTLTNDYQEQYFLTRDTATAQTLAWLSKPLADLKLQVEASQQKLVDYQKKNGILGTDGTNNVVMTRLEDLNKQLTDAQGNRITRQVISQLVKSGNAELMSGLAGDSLTATGSSALNSLSLLQTLRAQEAELKIQYAQAASKFGPAYPKLVEMTNQMDALDAAIQNEVQKVASRAENDYLTALNTEKMLQAAFEKQKTEANELNDKAVQYNILKREADSSSNLYDELLGKLKSAGVLSGLRSTKIVVIDPARPGAEPVRPSYPINLAIGLAGGLSLGVASAFIKESTDKTVHGPDQIEAVTLLPQLGFIPDFRFNSLTGGVYPEKLRGRATIQTSRRPMLGEVRPLAIAAPDSCAAEAYRQIRSSITLSDFEFPSVLLLTSPLSQEGKTTTAINLAVVLAQQGAKVLLVDADLRRPSIQSRLKMSSAAGLSSLLVAKNGADSGIEEYADQPGLFVLGAGPKPTYPAELLGSPHMAELIKVWRTRFDVVLLDTSPVLPVTDAVVLSSKVDGVLLVVRSETTTTQSLLRTRDVLCRANAKIAGFIANAVDLNSWDYQHYYG